MVDMELLYLLLLIFLYAVIPCVPAVLLRIKFQRSASKWIAVAATAIGVVCFLLIISGSDAVLENETLAIFTQCALTSSVPVLYCAAFCGTGKNIWIALVAPLLYFFGFFIRFAITSGLSETINFLRYLDPEFVFSQNPDPYILMTMTTLIIMSVISVIWSLICIFISSMTYKFIIKQQEKIKNKKRSKRRRPGQI